MIFNQLFELCKSKNTILYDRYAEPNIFSKRLVFLLKVVGRKNFININKVYVPATQTIIETENDYLWIFRQKYEKHLGLIKFFGCKIETTWDFYDKNIILPKDKFNICLACDEEEKDGFLGAF